MFNSLFKKALFFGLCIKNKVRQLEELNFYPLKFNSLLKRTLFVRLCIKNKVRQSFSTLSSLGFRVNKIDKTHKNLKNTTNRSKVITCLK